jgi:hypothetical protein
MSEKNVQSFLREIKAELDAMTPDDACDGRCVMCEACELPITEALTSAMLIGHDVAIESAEYRMHLLNHHMCPSHLEAFLKCMVRDGRTTFGR